MANPVWKAIKLKQKRPRSKALQSVYNSILDDLVYPAEIVGKKIRIGLDVFFHSSKFSFHTPHLPVTLDRQDLDQKLGQQTN